MSPEELTDLIRLNAQVAREFAQALQELADLLQNQDADHNPREEKTYAPKVI